MTREEAVEKGLTDAQKRKLEESLYKPLDEFLKRLKRKIKAIFSPLFVSGFDQLNIIMLSKQTSEMYLELDEFNRENYLALVKHARKWVEKLLGKELPTLDARELVDKYLKGYDPVTQYVYTKEVDRKRMRLNEAISTAREYQDVVKLHKAVKKAADLWFTQSSQYALDLMLFEIREAIEDDDGISLLRWNTQQDEKVCPDCNALDGKLFDADTYPDPLHYNCRCYPTPENPENLV